MTEPRVERAADVIARLLKRAADLKPGGEHKRADWLRREAAAITERCETWAANF